MDANEVKALLDPDEPDYAAAALLVGPDDLPHLAELARGDDAMLASKAVYLAGLVGGEASAPILTEAAANADSVVRVSAAAALRNVEDDLAVEIGNQLMADGDLGVRKVTVQSAAESGSRRLRAAVREVVEVDADEAIRAMAPDLDD